MSEEAAARTPRESPLSRTDGGGPEALGSAPAVLGGGPGLLGGGPGILGGGPRSLSGMQQTLGNAATARAVRRGKRPAHRPPSIDERAEQGSSCRRT
ncbi:hypothetical protein EQG64_20280 [Streptomyces sp. S6]|nr:hypothetical protein EQG64_20280 [Streptomyces sp. S6]